MRNVPDVRYAKSGDIRIAYQVVGDGPIDLVFVPGWVSNIEVSWEHPGFARFYERLSSFARLILFDKRGTGLSDRVDHDSLPTLEQRMDDLRAVMDDVGSERAALFGHSEGGNMCILFAATYPRRTRALITYGIFAKRVRSPDYPWAPSPDEREEWLRTVEREWGSEVDLETIAPSVADDPSFRQWWSRYLRMSAGPSAAVALGRMNTSIDVRPVLPSIQVPTLVLHQTGDREVDVEEARYIAERIPDADLVELEGEDHLFFTSGMERTLDEVETFLTGATGATTSDRMLATVLFTDIVDSTMRATEMGDRRWRETLELHNAMVRQNLQRWRGREVKTTGDGFLATFDGPARAIGCACAIRERARETGFAVRAGLHTGECETMGDDVGGIAVHIAARVLGEAGDGEVLVSRTVKDLVAGSGIRFADRGVHDLKGVEGEWGLFAVE